MKTGRCVFLNDGKEWKQEAKIAASDGTLSDNFGAAVAIDDNLIAEGAPPRNGDNRIGGVYIFEIGDGTGKRRSSSNRPKDLFTTLATVWRSTTHASPLVPGPPTSIDGSVPVPPISPKRSETNGDSARKLPQTMEGRLIGLVGALPCKTTCCWPPCRTMMSWATRLVRSLSFCSPKARIQIQ